MKQHNRSRRHRRLLILLALLAVIMSGSILFTSIRLYTVQVRESREKYAEGAAKLAADMVDGDMVDRWLERGPDEEYYEEARLLGNVLSDTADIYYLYVYQIRPDACYVVFDSDSGEMNTGVLGNKIEFDPTFLPYIPTLLEGGEMEAIESNDAYGWLLTKYEPIFDSKGKCVAYAGADISMTDIYEYIRKFTRYTVLISLVFLIGGLLIGLRLYNDTHRADETDALIEQQKHDKLFIREIIEALASAIDAKDKYTHGHSRRVAEYSQMIARESGKSEKECEEIYLAALLHDVGKIGIRDAIINKEGRLTDEEYGVIKAHPVIGEQILSSITLSPYLGIGANYHHERYDGRGYPSQLKGEDIPDIARIIAVADAYDAMTSNRSYRSIIPQPLVREEITKGSGTQFDPQYAKIMYHLIDLDMDYNMREKAEVKELSGDDHLSCGDYMTDFSEGILVTDKPLRIHMHSKPDDGFPPAESIPALLLFDSIDGRVYRNEPEKSMMVYYDYAEIRADGRCLCVGARKTQSKTNVLVPLSDDEETELAKKGFDYEISAYRYKDHMLIKIATKYTVHETIIALPDNSRFTYIAMTGEHCDITDVDISHPDEPIGPGLIPRIAEEISYINVPSGDLPNVQIDWWCAAATEGIPVTDGMTLSFHAMSLPTARLIWHCPYIILFYSDDKQFKGKNYREFAMIRLDGESWESSGEIENKPIINKTDSFTDWNEWKKLVKQGIDCEVVFKRNGNSVTVTTENCGIAIKDIMTVNYNVPEIYAAITGDQVAVTNIRITRI